MTAYTFVLNYPNGDFKKHEYTAAHDGYAKSAAEFYLINNPAAVSVDVVKDGQTIATIK